MSSTQTHEAHRHGCNKTYRLPLPFRGSAEYIYAEMQQNWLQYLMSVAERHKAFGPASRKPTAINDEVSRSSRRRRERLVIGTHGLAIHECGYICLDRTSCQHTTYVTLSSQAAFNRSSFNHLQGPSIRSAPGFRCGIEGALSSWFLYDLVQRFLLDEEDLEKHSGEASG